MHFRHLIQSTLLSFLTLSVVVIYGIGSVAGIELAHEHEVAHASDFSEDSHHHHHHHHHGDDDHQDGGGEDSSGEDGSPSHPHSHFITFDTQMATGQPNTLSCKVSEFSSERLAPEVALRPDEPFYELEQPPLIGLS